MNYYFFKMAKSNTRCRKQWDKRAMESAIQAVRQKEMGFLKAAKRINFIKIKRSF